MTTFIIEAGSPEAEAVRSLLDAEPATAAEPPAGDDNDHYDVASDAGDGNHLHAQAANDSTHSTSYAPAIVNTEEESTQEDVLYEDGMAAVPQVGRRSSRSQRMFASSGVLLAPVSGVSSSSNGGGSSSSSAQGETPSGQGDMLALNTKEELVDLARLHTSLLVSILGASMLPLGYIVFWLMRAAVGPAQHGAGIAVVTTHAVWVAICSRGAFASRGVWYLSQVDSIRIAVALLATSSWMFTACAVHVVCSQMDHTDRGHITYFYDIHAMASIVWVAAAVPARWFWFLEVGRNLTFVAASVAIQWQYMDLHAIAYVLLLALGQSLLCPIYLVCIAGMYGVKADAAAVNTPWGEWDTCPEALRSARDAAISTAEDVRQTLVGDNLLLESSGGLVFVLRTAYSLVRLSLALDIADGMREVSADMRATLLFIIMATLTNRLHAASKTAQSKSSVGNTAALKRATLLRDLRERLASARSETAILTAGAAALQALFPDACGVACAVFAQGSSCDVVTSLEVAASDDATKAAIIASLPADCGAPPTTGQLATSVSRACRRQASSSLGAAVLDSASFPHGLTECADWVAALKAGVPAARALTVPLTAGPVTVGFAQVFFTSGVDSDSHDSQQALLSCLGEAADVVGGAVFVRRAFAINRENSRSVPVLMPAAGAPGSGGIRRTASNTFRLGSSDGPSSNGSAVTYPATEADSAALAILDARRAADMATLDSWSLDAWQLPDDEVQRLFSTMLHGLGLFRRFSISPTAFATFISDVATHYSDNPFHCFKHAFMVTHTAWLFLRHDPLRKLLEDLDCLALLFAAICHDAEHPGTTNAFQVNTCSPLALRYNDASVLENHHAAVGFAALVRCHVLTGLSLDELRALRRSFVAAVLATDMSVHKQLLASVNETLKRSAAGEEGDHPDGARTSSHTTVLGAAGRQAPAVGGGFARRSPEDRVLLVNFLLHCADLGNPLLPPSLSRRIAYDLSREFEAQAEQERQAGLPVTVMLAADDAGKAKLELGFLEYVVRPLYVSLAQCVPKLGDKCLRLIDTNKAEWQSLF